MISTHPSYVYSIQTWQIAIAVMVQELKQVLQPVVGGDYDATTIFSLSLPDRISIDEFLCKIIWYARYTTSQAFVTRTLSTPNTTLDFVLLAFCTYQSVTKSALCESVVTYMLASRSIWLCPLCPIRSGPVLSPIWAVCYSPY